MQYICTRYSGWLLTTSDNYIQIRHSYALKERLGITTPPSNLNFPCAPGTRYNTTNSDCQACRPGMYTDELGLSTCKSCTAGFSAAFCCYFFIKQGLLCRHSGCLGVAPLAGVWMRARCAVAKYIAVPRYLVIPSLKTLDEVIILLQPPCNL